MSDSPQQQPSRTDPIAGSADGNPRRRRKARGPNTPPTQAVIARAAGVSQMSVSLALRNHPSLPEETRNRIRRVAERLGYRPNPMLSTLMRQVRMRRRAESSVTLAYLTSFPSRDGWRDRPLWNDYHEGARERANHLGYQFEEFWLREPGMTGRRLSEILYTRSIQGVVVAPPPRGRAHMTFEWARFSCATIGWALWRPSLHRAATHQLQSVAIAVRELRHLGYERIGLALPHEIDLRSNHNWAAGFLYHASNGAPRGSAPALVAQDWSRERFLQWYATAHPEAVLSTELDALDWLRETGARVPEDVGFVHLEWSPETGEILSGIRQNSRFVGAAAVDLVVEQLERNERGTPPHPKVVMIEGEWVRGDSTRARSGAGRFEEPLSLPQLARRTQDAPPARIFHAGA